MKFLVLVFTLVLSSACFAESRCGPHYSSHHGSYGPSCYVPYRPMFGVYVSPPVSSGYYETRTETVMIAPEQVERQWVNPVFVTKYDSVGRPYNDKVADGYYREVVVPARYEVRTVRVWVPGYYYGPVYSAPALVGGAFYSGRHVSAGIGFGF